MTIEYYVRCRSLNIPTIILGKELEHWCFRLYLYPANGCRSLEEWKKTIATRDAEISSSTSNRQINPADLLDKILNRQGNTCFRKPLVGYTSWRVHQVERSSLFGPNQLLRKKIGADGCVGHGDGPYDLFEGKLPGYSYYATTSYTAYLPEYDRRIRNTYGPY